MILSSFVVIVKVWQNAFEIDWPVMSLPEFGADLKGDISFAWIFCSTAPTGEVWVGVTLAVVIELVPTALRTTSVALYLFIISNIGGNAPLIVPGLQAAFEHMGATTITALRGNVTDHSKSWLKTKGFPVSNH